LARAPKSIYSDIMSRSAQRMSQSTKPWHGMEVGGLVTAAVSAVILVTAISLMTIPYSRTVRQDIPLDILWRSGLWQQVTGFLLLGFSLICLSLYFRKHWRRLRFGSFSSWRVLHGILGVAGLIVLVAHTGMRFGSNLNLALMIVFVAANLGGALAAAGIWSRYQFTKHPSHRWRRRMVWIHVLMLSPLPVLIALHILSVYYF